MTLAAAPLEPGTPLPSGTGRPPRRRRSVSTIAAAGAAGGVLLIAVLGPLVAPYSPTEQVGGPYARPGDGLLLGADPLGRDVLSRVLHGGIDLIVAAVPASLLSTLTGASLGMAAALAGERHPRWEGVLIRPLDALIAIPPLIMLLLVLAALPNRAGVVVAGTVAGAPLAARVALATTKPLLTRAHVEVARARGESAGWIARHEIAPLAAAPVLADAGLRFVTAFYLVTAAGFLGIDLGGSDWGTLIVEALPGASLQPVAVIAPLALIAALAVSVNLLADRLVHRNERLLG